MTEQEYIDVYNLALITEILGSIRNMLPMEDNEQKKISEFADQLVIWQTNLHKKINTEE